MSFAYFGLAGAAFGISAIASYNVQNPLAKSLFSDIPKYAVPYPCIGRLKNGDASNTSILGVLAGGAVAGGLFFLTRGRGKAYTEFLRQEFIYHPGTSTPRRINSLKSLFLDFCPALTILLARGALILPAFFVTKVYVEGSGRFKDYNTKSNPYAL